MKIPLLGLDLSRYDPNLIQESFGKNLAVKLSGSKRRKDTYQIHINYLVTQIYLYSSQVSAISTEDSRGFSFIGCGTIKISLKENNIGDNQFPKERVDNKFLYELKCTWLNMEIYI